MKLIPLNQGQFAQVDDEDFEEVNKYRWYALKRNNTYYVRQTTVNILLHRFLMKCKKGDGKMIDHIDRNALNNQRNNLRFCTYSENNSNRVYKNPRKKRIKIQKKKDYQYITQHKAGKWQVGFNRKNKFTYLGFYETLQEAILERDILIPLFNFTI